MIGKLREKKEKILSGLRLTQRRLTAMEAMRKKKIKRLVVQSACGSLKGGSITVLFIVER